MKSCYKKELSSLIELVDNSRDKLVVNTENFRQSYNFLIALGDAHFETYRSIVDTSELRIKAAIERIAVYLFTEISYKNFYLYPVDPQYSNLAPEIQRNAPKPFQIVLTENQKKCGVNFCDENYYFKFTHGHYNVDALKIIKFANPNQMATSDITFTNDLNRKAEINIEYIPILDFWRQYFGDSECDELINFINEFNAKCKEIIGYNTVITPTEKALAKFRTTVGTMLSTRDYFSDIPNTIYTEQIDILKYNYLKRGLWKAMVGKSNFAVSFITAEWFYKMYELTENLDLTSIVSGYFKSVEQLLYSVLELSARSGLLIHSKQTGRPLVEFSMENSEIIDTTLSSLENVVIDNSNLLDVTPYVKNYLTNAIKKWRKNYRNPHTHKNNLHSIDTVTQIRKETLQLYFLILGGFKINDNQLHNLGIEE